MYCGLVQGGSKLRHRLGDDGATGMKVSLSLCTLECGAASKGILMSADIQACQCLALGGKEGGKGGLTALKGLREGSVHSKRFENVAGLLPAISHASGLSCLWSLAR